MKMRAMVLPRFGESKLFEMKEIDRPEPGPGEILVRVHASGVNPVDAKLRQNGSWAQLKPPVILGYDAAGKIEKLGPGVSNFKVGDDVYYTPEIFGNQWGTYAEFNIVPAQLVAHKPSGLSYEEAAAIPLAGGTAWEAIVRRLKILPGETVLIHGAAGGVGSYAVQFAKASGARVIATASPKNHEMLRKLGADVTVDYHTTDAAEIAEIALKESGGMGVDAAFDIEGTNRVARCLPSLRSFGRIACILPPEGDLSLLYTKNITLFGTFLTRESKRLEEMRPVFERKQAISLVDEVLPLEKVANAHDRMDSQHGRGKVVLKI